jgi:hypothetical protein
MRKVSTQYLPHFLPLIWTPFLSFVLQIEAHLTLALRGRIDDTYNQVIKSYLLFYQSDFRKSSHFRTSH